MTGIKFSAFQSHRAFTLVEVIVVIAVITVLATVGTITTSKYQQNARDSERESKVNIIASSLEKYFEDNNEYPSCTLITAAPSTVKSATLKSLVNEDVLRAPRAASGTNSIKCAANAPSGTSTFTYTCLSTTACAKWELRYRKESDGTVKSIASAHSGASSADGSVALNSPNVDLAAEVSGSVATGTATATCQSGAAKYQIRSYKNSGSFPATWIDGSSATVSPLSEGESATFQAQAQCTQAGVASSEYVQSDSVTATRTVTPPTGLTTSVTISGANATGTVTGGSCAAGTSLMRQIRSITANYLYGGTWTDFQDIAGTSQTLPINEGWQYSFQQLARCMNSTTGVGSDWTWGPIGDAIRPISTLGAPSVSASGNSSYIRYTWSGAACPTGTSKEYRWLLQRNDGYASDWWGPSSGTTFDWNDVSEGYTFTAIVQQRCISGFTTGAWSANASASYSRPVTAPGAPGGFTTERVGTGGIAFKWNAPACKWPTGGQWRADWVNGGGPGITWISPPSGHADYWWYGGSSTAYTSANPSSAWSTAWPSYGFLGDRNNPYSISPPRMNLDNVTNGAFDSGNIIGIAVEYRCINTATGVAGPVGGLGGYKYTW